ncbi:MAG: 3-methyl-2-oxobutanoate dehydrogenase subunit VorB [Planctomycetota bacterium]|jgi:2-oxoglutarate ferredoxin oxidoreductase subunit alpha
MAERVLMTGNEALAEGAIRGGCDCYFGYPITPQNELTAYMAKHMTAKERVFIQSESEIAAINMVLGAAAAGARAMTSSSSPGVSLKQEGISYLAACRLPSLIVNVMRAGPGLGDITPSQADYFQATRGGGHGDYRTIVFSPATVQEMHDFAATAFDIADKYRNPVMILADGRLGQMMEPLKLWDAPANPPKKDWILRGAVGDEKRTIRSYYAGGVPQNNELIQQTLRKIETNEVRYETYLMDDAEIMLVAYGTAARLCRGAIDQVRAEGIRVGLLRPQTVWPFPMQAIGDLCGQVSKVLAVEMSGGQMLEDVKLAVEGRADVHFYGTMGGDVPSVADVAEQIRQLT